MHCSQLPGTVDNTELFRFGRRISLTNWEENPLDYYNNHPIPHYSSYPVAPSSPVTPVSGMENSLGLHQYIPPSSASPLGEYHYLPLPTESMPMKLEDQSCNGLYSQQQSDSAYYSDESLPQLDHTNYSDEQYMYEDSPQQEVRLQESGSSSPEPTFGGACKPFILKIAFLLSQPELYSDVARWDSTGTIFIITVSPRFKEVVLPQLFSHSSQNAFTRQLTTYSFQHLKAVDCPEIKGKGKGLSIWKHPDFTRDDTTTLNRLVPRPSKARIIHSKEKVASSTLLAYSRRFLNGRGST